MGGLELAAERLQKPFIEGSTRPSPCGLLVCGKAGAFKPQAAAFGEWTSGARVLANKHISRGVWPARDRRVMALKVEVH